MLLTPRTFELAQYPDKGSSRLNSPFIKCAPSWHEQRAARKHAEKMLLLHQTGVVKVGDVVRYTLTYDSSSDRILPSPTHLHVRIKNSSAIAFRAAYLHGPYTLHVAIYPSWFNPNEKLRNPKKYGAPQFEANVKAGAYFSGKIPVPEEIRVTGQNPPSTGAPKTLTWIVEITSQIIFSSSASINFEFLASRDEKSLDYGFTAVSHSGQGEPGRVHDHQQGKHKSPRHAGHGTGVYSKAITLHVEDTLSLWNKPALPEKDGPKPRRSLSMRRKSSGSIHHKAAPEPAKKPKKKKKKKIHLVILTHGLHSNLSADMLYLKESIDATVKEARMKRRREKAGLSTDPEVHAATAVLSGGQEDLPEDDSDDDEEVIVRGFTGNAVRTENGIQYLGKRLAKFILDFTYPDQPYKPLRKSMSKKLSDVMTNKSSSQDSEGTPAHNGSSIRQDEQDHELPYTFTSISFVGHSLGGLIQVYAIGYIHKHAPHFFEQIKPVNFICMASPMLGLSNENPIYVKFALDFGLVGRTGQDLGLAWRPPALARSGWSAVMSGLGQKDPEPTPESKPLLRVLPTGPAHKVLKMFRNRTVYSNVVNDGIVPLRTSCLLFLDWRGLGKVEKARRENGLIGTVAGWGWAEITGQSTTRTEEPARVEPARMDGAGSDAEDESGDNEGDKSTVPQPWANAGNEDDEVLQAVHTSQRRSMEGTAEERNTKPPSPSALMTFFNYFRIPAKNSKKDVKMFKRSQTIKMDEEGTESPAPSEDPSGVDQAESSRPRVTRGDSLSSNAASDIAPPKTTIFESAGDILNPPIPPTSWIIDPTTRTRTIFHDRIYHPDDIPPPPPSRKSTRAPPRSSSGEASSPSPAPDSIPAPQPKPASEGGGMRVEEKIARAYHRDLSWRKVLVRLEPDAHNNMIVRRMFANAYGWPVVKHLCDTHFGDTYAAETADELEPAIERAKPIDQPVGEHGEHVLGQESRAPPAVLSRSSTKGEEGDGLAPLGSHARSLSREERPSTACTGITSVGSSWDEAYFRDTTSDDDEDLRGPLGRFLSPQAIRGAGGHSRTGSAVKSEASAGTSEAEIADFLSASPPPMEAHRGLKPAPVRRSVTEVGLGMPAAEAVRKVMSEGEEGGTGVVEEVVRASQSRD
ncbi:DUF676-domain-containing protein [Trichodelitschia bisporula]|uniref:DUF676-domain-containing protein n=1 Tax=Trichodelitschia bisporula TaxID=703511 RepID=A0A6G1HJI7_9PEZI|nr:DUF676-domain-containing protein [Trichodelitschia bisporula]